MRLSEAVKLLKPGLKLVNMQDGFAAVLGEDDLIMFEDSKEAFGFTLSDFESEDWVVHN